VPVGVDRMSRRSWGSGADPYPHAATSHDHKRLSLGDVAEDDWSARRELIRTRMVRVSGPCKNTDRNALWTPWSAGLEVACG
jgi:hypothetical protein